MNPFVPRAPAARPGGDQRPLRVLVVNAYFDDWRANTRSPYKVPQAMAPYHAAGIFRRELCDVRVYSEHHSGPLLDPAVYAWPDVLVLSGLNVAFDRMLHVCAYARSRRPGVLVIAGGHAVRALPQRAAQFFDYACTGDVEELAAIISAEFGPDYVADTFTPRYDLVPHNPWLGYAEASRNCNFKCGFCTLTGERRAYTTVETETLRANVLAMGYKRHLLFLDNNFYGGGQRVFHERMALLRELHRARRFGGWSAMVTSDFFYDAENLALAREAGCVALFSGIESFDDEELRRASKRQNLVLPQFNVIERCLDAGIMFHYGIIFDLSARRLEDVERELDMLLTNDQVPMPSFLSLTIPLLGTPFFTECVRDGLLLPSTRLRDMDGYTLTLRPRDPLEDVVPFVRDLPTLRGHRLRLFAKNLRFMARYRQSMSAFQLMLTAANAFLLSMPNVVNAPLRRQAAQAPRTCVSTTEPLDPLYVPAFPLDPRYREYFRPTLVTDEEGALAADMLRDYAADGTRAGTPRASRPPLPDPRTGTAAVAQP